MITPRINQSLITAPDPFAIDTTVINIHEINEVGARCANPGMVLALQVSMSTRPEALIALYRKMRARRDYVLRDHPGTDFVLVTANSSVVSAVEALRMGATDYLEKPVRPEDLILALERALGRRRLFKENHRLRDERGCQVRFRS